MKKKFIALFAACSMITTAVAGLVQTAYADDDPISIVVSNGATDTEKVLTFYYNTDGINMFEGNLTLDNGATIDSTAVTIPMQSGGMSDQTSDTSGYFMCLTYGTTPLSSDDHSFATATVTVPGDVDVTVSFEFTLLERDDNDCSATVTATIPANSGSSGGGETTVTVTPTVADSKAYVDAKDDSKKAVVGKVELEIDGGSYVFDRSKITYGTTGEHPTVTDLNDNALDDEAVNALIVSATDLIVYIVINGTTDVAELDKVTFE